jgi:hypothetical protein
LNTAAAVAQDAAEHLRFRRRAGDLFDFGLAVDRKQANAEFKGARDIALLLDGVAIGDAVGRAAGRDHHLDLGDRSGVEAGAHRGEQGQHLRRRVCLHRVEHAAVRQRLGKGLVIVAHDIEVHDEDGAVLLAVAQELADAIGHLTLQNGSGDGSAVRDECRSAIDASARWRRDERRDHDPTVLPWIGKGGPVPHTWQ